MTHVLIQIGDAQDQFQKFEVFFGIGNGSFSAQYFHDAIHLNEQPFETILVDTVSVAGKIRCLVEFLKYVFDIVVQTAAVVFETLRNLKVASRNATRTAGSR